MPRASWRGFLRLSLVSCPIYLSPATTRAKSIRLHQVWPTTMHGDFNLDLCRLGADGMRTLLAHRLVPSDRRRFLADDRHIDQQR